MRQKEARADATPSFDRRVTASELQSALDVTEGELDLTKGQLDRALRVIDYSGRYDVPADLAGDIYDIALAEGIEPELGFRLVRIESEFNERATSPVGAIGLTQLMLPTAKYFQKGVTRESLYDRRTNLRVGFRYLRVLIRESKGDIKLALLVYNRGPVAVNAARAKGLDPANGYDRMVMTGYKGKGVID
ncbi:MAG: lytic transglycosylase domain-containing protein [Gemmatimonadaceae bacterium]